MLLGAELCEFGSVLSGVSTFPKLFSQILECALWFPRWSGKIFEAIMGFYNFIYLFLQYYGCNIDENTVGKCLDCHQLLDKTWNKIYFSAYFDLLLSTIEVGIKYSKLLRGFTHLEWNQRKEARWREIKMWNIHQDVLLLNIG